MPGKEQNNQNDFMIEKIKTRPINRRKLIRRTIITAAMAVIFGLIACFTFLVLEPVISNWLYPEEDATEYVQFPEDQEEMSPEDMLAENLPTESPSPAPPPVESGLEEEQIQEILAEVDLGIENYAQLYGALEDLIYDFYISEDGSEFRAGLSQYMVTIRGVTSNIDWFDGVQESSNQAPGLIIADNGVELLILVDYTSLENAENLVLDLSDGYYQIDAELKGVDKDTNLAVVGVGLNYLPIEWMEIDGLKVATLGSSSGNHLEGTPVVAMGSPMGVSDSIGYGIISSAGTWFARSDRYYRVLLTDIYGSRNAEGVLFNLQGQVIGIVTKNKTGNDTGNLICAYGVTEIKRIIEKLSNEKSFAYLGITGTDVTVAAFSRQGVPYGAYVTEVDMDSPAMLAGIQVGDVITAINDVQIGSFKGYCTQLMQMEPGQQVELTVMRQAQEEYREMNFSIELGER